MGAEGEKVRITISVDKEYVDKIDELAKRMGTSQSRMASMLVETGLEDNEWIIRFVTSRAVKGLKEFLTTSGKTRRREKPA